MKSIYWMRKNIGKFIVITIWICLNFPWYYLGETDTVFGFILINGLVALFIFKVLWPQLKRDIPPPKPKDLKIPQKRSNLQPMKGLRQVCLILSILFIVIGIVGGIKEAPLYYTLISDQLQYILGSTLAMFVHISATWLLYLIIAGIRLIVLRYRKRQLL